MTPDKNIPDEQYENPMEGKDGGWKIKADLLICFLVGIAGVIAVAKTLEILTR